MGEVRPVGGGVGVLLPPLLSERVRRRGLAGDVLRARLPRRRRVRLDWGPLGAETDAALLNLPVQVALAVVPGWRTRRRGGGTFTTQSVGTSRDDFLSSSPPALRLGDSRAMTQLAGLGKPPLAS